jgi:phosphopantetheine--protein transferase-like protein
MQEVISYLSRLTGTPISPDEAFQLRSLHRAAFTSWARKQNVPVRISIMTAGTPFTIRQLLGSEEEALAAAPVARTTAVAPPANSAVTGGIGIDIEEVGNLPEAEDYREHPFFQDHFTGKEMAYCIRQADVRASFCGIWAAKESMLKAGLIPSSAPRMNEFEIDRAESGAPIFPGCSISISHTRNTAVAMCVATAAEPALQAPASKPELIAACEPETAPATGKRWPWSRTK